MTSPQKSRIQQSTVLVLEDEEGLADLYTVWLSEEYSVRTAYTAAQAREQFDEAVDVALIDRRLRDEKGDEFLSWVSQHHPECCRAMVTAVNPDVDLIELPLDEYLVKPVDKDELLATVQRLEEQRNYEEEIRDLCALATKRAHLESALSKTERSDNEQFTRLESEISDRKQTLMEANEDFPEIVRHLEGNLNGD